jgi:hypothetical protein
LDRGTSRHKAFLVGFHAADGVGTRQQEKLTQLSARFPHPRRLLGVGLSFVH